MENKRLGIIGGMGPKATSVFFDKIIENTVADRDQDHIDMIILNHSTLPDRTDVILKNDPERFLNAVEKDIRLLEHAGVQNIAIPCNTSHYFHERMQAMTDVHIIHIIHETLKVVRDKFGPRSKVGILATNGTLQSGIYNSACQKYGMELHVPDEPVQQRIMDIIYNDIKRGLAISSTGIEDIIHKLITDDQCNCVIIACTELSCITLSAQTQAYCVDAMDVLVKRSIELSGKHSRLKFS